MKTTKKEKAIRRNHCFYDSQYSRLVKLSELQRKSVSAVLRELVNEYLEKHRIKQ